MLESKNKMQKLITSLENELRLEKAKVERSALREKANLPQCESLACCSCRHATYKFYPHGGCVLLGCGKDLSCKHFERDPVNVPAIEERLKLMQEHLREQLGL